MIFSSTALIRYSNQVVLLFSNHLKFLQLKMKSVMRYKVKVIINGSDDVIDDYASKHGTIYHMTCWASIIKKVFSHDTYYFYALDDKDNVCGLLPVVHLSSMLFGKFLVSMPYFNYGGVVADNTKIRALLIDSAIEIATELNADHIEFRGTERIDDLPVREDKVNMILELPDNLDLLGVQIGSKKRSQVRRPLRDGVISVCGGPELLDRFYDVFSENMRDLGTPVYPKIFFKEILDHFPDSTQIVILQKDTKSISAAFLIGFKDTLEIPWASTLRKYNSFSPNMLLYWEVLTYAINNKYKIFDFGRSSIDSGTYRFKKQWGAKPLQLYWHYWVKEGGAIPQLNPNNPKYKLMIDIWKRMPLWATNLVGPKIVKNLP